MSVLGFPQVLLHGQALVRIAQVRLSLFPPPVSPLFPLFLFPLPCFPSSLVPSKLPLLSYVPSLRKVVKGSTCQIITDEVGSSRTARVMIEGEVGSGWFSTQSRPPVSNRPTQRPELRWVNHCTQARFLILRRIQ